MPEVIMEYDLDETGKMVNLVRKEEVVRCKDCVFCSMDKEFHLHWCDGDMANPNGYCNEGRRR